MGLCLKLSVPILGIIAYFVVSSLYYVPPVPKLENTWWGKGQPGKEDKSIKPFKIQVPDEVLKDLQQRLSNKRPLVPPLEGIQQQYGINTNLLNEIIEFWKTKYNWREQEKFLNKYPQFKTRIQGLNIHYIHVKPAKTNGLKVLPLLLLHGWPGSVREFYEIIPFLTTPQTGRDFVFEVIVPSLPGYGFSDAAVRPGLGMAQMAVIFNNLMNRVGFNKYYIQGGDWGGAIVQHMAIIYPENILGVHSNFCYINTPLSNLKLILGSIYPPLIVSKEYEHRVYPLSKLYSYILEEFGYMHLQATKPDTAGVALNDSPVGLAAYIIEKFTTWTNADWKNLPDGGLTKKFSYTKLLDNVMIYWVTNSITTSMRLYAESFSKAQFSLQFDSIPVKVPSACARFANELTYPPDTVLADKYKNLVQVTDYNDGGHFAAFEVPELLAKDIYMGVEKFIQSSKKHDNKEL